MFGLILPPKQAYWTKTTIGTKMKLSFSFGCVIAVFLIGQSYAQPSVRVEHGPYISAVGQTEFSVVWTTTVDAVGWVEVAPDDGSHFYAAERPRYEQTHFGRRPIGQLHAVRVTGLEAGTTYRYRVMQEAVLFDQGKTRVLYGESYGSDVQYRKPYAVTTLDARKERIRFAVANDMHEHDAEFRALFADVDRKRFDFVCLNGDMSTFIDDENALFDNWLQGASELFAAETPLYVARGNHKNRGKFAMRFMNYFPSVNGVPYYMFRHGPVCFVVLDSGEDKPDSDIRNLNLMRSDRFRLEEAEWLRGVVDSEVFRSAPVKIVFCHMPPSINGWYGCREVQRLFVPILNEAGIDLMLSGHIHGYRFTPADSTGACRFPVVCNAARERLEVEVSRDTIAIHAYDIKGVVTHSVGLKP